MEITKLRIGTLALVLFASALLLGGQAHQALASIGLRIQPVKISQTLSPGETTKGIITLINESDRPVDVYVTVSDFIPTAGADSIQFVDRVEGVTSVKDWITVEEDKVFSFKVGESREIPYEIKAPLDAEPGGHFGAVFFKAVDATEESTLRIGTQVGMLVLIAIPGNHLQKGEIKDFAAEKFIQSGPVPFEIQFENTGTVHFEPKGDIAISNMFGKVIGHAPIEGQVVLPTSIKTLVEHWNVEGLLVGRYTAKATIVDGEGNELTSDKVSFWAFPLWYTLGFVVIMAVIFLVLRFLKRNVRISIVRK